MPDPSGVYIDELSTLFRGRAIHNPRRARLQSGCGLRPAVDIGDVVYECEGQLTRLFNCLKSASDQDEDSELTDDFEQLIRPTSSRATGHQVTIPSGIRIEERLTHAGPYFSKGVKRIEVDIGASVASSAGASFAFSTLRKQGAVLLTSGTIKTRVSPNRPAFEQYMIKHFDSWCSLIGSLYLEVQPEGLMLITAADYTSTWSNLVYTERQLQGNFSVDVPAVATIEGQVSVRMDIRRTQSETRDWGPNSEDLEIERNQVALSDNHPRSLENDQVIFIRGLRGKRRIFKGFAKLVGEAEPMDLGEGNPPESDSHSEVVVETVGELPREKDYLTPALDFILENTDADITIVHDEDYETFLRHQQSTPQSFADKIIRLERTVNGISYGAFNECQTSCSPTATERFHAAMHIKDEIQLDMADAEPQAGVQRADKDALSEDLPPPVDPSVFRSDINIRPPVKKTTSLTVRADSEWLGPSGIQFYIIVHKTSKPKTYEWSLVPRIAGAPLPGRAPINHFEITKVRRRGHADREWVTTVKQRIFHTSHRFLGVLALPPCDYKATTTDDVEEILRQVAPVPQSLSPEEQRRWTCPKWIVDILVEWGPVWGLNFTSQFNENRDLLLTCLTTLSTWLEEERYERVSTGDGYEYFCVRVPELRMMPPANPPVDIRGSLPARAPLPSPWTTAAFAEVR